MITQLSRRDAAKLATSIEGEAAVKYALLERCRGVVALPGGTGYDHGEAA